MIRPIRYSWPRPGRSETPLRSNRDEKAGRGERSTNIGGRATVEKEGSEEREKEREREGGRRKERTAVDMLRCHCVVPAPVGRCRCLDCNIVLYCLLAPVFHDRLRARQPVQIPPPIRRTYVRTVSKPSLPLSHSPFPSLSPDECASGRPHSMFTGVTRDKDHPLIRNRGIYYLVPRAGNNDTSTSLSSSLFNESITEKLSIRFDSISFSNSSEARVEIIRIS